MEWKVEREWWLQKTRWSHGHSGFFKLESPLLVLGFLGQSANLECKAALKTSRSVFVQDFGLGSFI